MAEFRVEGLRGLGVEGFRGLGFRGLVEVYALKGQRDNVEVKLGLYRGYIGVRYRI